MHENAQDPHVAAIFSELFTDLSKVAPFKGYEHLPAILKEAGAVQLENICKNNWRKSCGKLRKIL